jgi:hypothetical protein
MQKQVDWIGFIHLFSAYNQNTNIDIMECLMLLEAIILYKVLVGDSYQK